LTCRGAVCPLVMLMFGYYKYAKFALIAHHHLHGGYGLKQRGSFAKGLVRRSIDWLDWIFPAAWVAEHNKVHHYYLNEDVDPDYVERNTESIQDMDCSNFLKYMMVVVQAMVWKWYYYASNTLKLLHANKPNAPCKADFDEPHVITYLLSQAISGNPWYRALAADFIIRVMLPPFLTHFVALPFLVGLLRGNGGWFPFCWCTFLNVCGAEMVTNVHAWATIVTNHAGGDLWWFATSCKPDTAEFYLRAVLGSTAYHAGNDWIDYFHGYLNYQGEHHAYPDLSALHYQRLHPHFKRVCAAHRVPYVQEPVWVRCKKTADVMVGLAKQKRIPSGLAIDNPEMWMTPQTWTDVADSPVMGN